MDGNSFLEQLDLTCTRLSLETRSQLREDNEIITEGFKLLNSTFHALVGYCDHDNTSSDILKSARTTIALHISKTLQGAFLLQERDMSSQSMGLCRNALEAALTWRHIEQTPSRVENWFNVARKDTPEFSFGQMVSNFPENQRARNLYRILCKHTHPSGMIFWSSVTITQSAYGVAQRRLACICILRITQMFLEIVLGQFPGKLFRNDEVVFDWHARSQATVERLLSASDLEFKEAMNWNRTDAENDRKR